MSFKEQEKRVINLVKILFQSFGKYKRKFLVLTIFGFISGVLEGIGINAIVPLFSFMTGDGIQATDFISQMIENFFTLLHLPFTVSSLLIFICLLFLIKAVINFFAKIQGTLIMTSYEKNERMTLLGYTLKTDWNYLMKQKIGYFEKILMVDVGTSSNLLTELSSSILLFTSLVMYIIVAVNIHFTITLVTLAFGAMIFLVLKPYIYKTRVYSQLVTKTNKYVANHVNENMMGIKTIKSLGVEDRVLKKGETFFNELKNSIVRISYYSNLPTIFIQPVSIIFIALVYIVFARFTAFNLGMFIVIMYLIQKIFSHIQSLQAKLQNVNQLLPFLKSVSECKKEILLHQEKNEGTKVFAFHNALAFRNVFFSYNRSKKSIIHDVSFTVHKGECVGLIGPSGAGKTTIVDLLLRLLKPQSGEILIDNNDISEILLHEWRKHVGYVSQDMFLVNDTIQNNIALYHPLSEKEIMEAARLANIDHFIQEQPEDLNTMVGERGVMLSGGQKQRIILARILARKPDVLILDEATSSLDNESELLIQKSLADLRGKITILIIAHRLSTVVDADRLIVIDKGKIIEQGAPTELLGDESSYFYKMHTIHNNGA